MLYKTLLKLKEKTGLTPDLLNKIDVLYACGRLTDDEYNTLIAVPDVDDEIATDETPVEE